MRASLWWTTLAMLGCLDFSLSDKDAAVALSVVVEETFLQDPIPRVDVIWLIDNTASMDSEHRYLSDHIEAFIDRLNGHQVSWQMGGITPDGEGILAGNPWVITPGNLSSFALASMIEVGTAGHQPSTGLAAIMAALSSPHAQIDNRGFRREGAALSVLIFSDGDDQSDAVIGTDPVGEYLDFMSDEATASQRPAVTSAIVGPDPAGCTSETGTATAGSRYSDAAAQTGGQSTSICDPDFDAIADAIADLGVHLAARFTLQASPHPANTRVSIDGIRRDTGWSIEGKTLHFDPPPATGSTIHVRYTVGEP